MHAVQFHSLSAVAREESVGEKRREDTVVHLNREREGRKESSVDRK